MQIWKATSRQHFLICSTDPLQRSSLLERRVRTNDVIQQKSVLCVVKKFGSTCAGVFLGCFGHLVGSRGMQKSE